MKKTKEKELEERSLKLKNMVDFNLVRKEPNSLEVRAYLYKILCDSFGLSVTLRELFKKEFPVLDDDVSKWDLNTITEFDIRRILKEQDLMPDEIFYFKKGYDPDVISDNDYKSLPEIYTRVCQVSFDKGGLIVLELYNSQIYLLFDAKGNCLLDRCHDLRLGTNGIVLMRTSKSIFWEMTQYNDESFNDREIFGPLDSPSDFPDIGRRDIIAEMLPADTFKKIKYDQSKILTNEEVELELKNNSESYHFLQKYYYDNEALAFIAVNSNLYAFTFLSVRLQYDKEYVIKLITARKENQRLYDYLNDELKADIEIVKLCIKDNPDIIRNIAPVSDRELMEEALKDHVFNLVYASDDLKADKKLVLSLVRKDWRVLREASKVLLSDRDFIAESIFCFNENQKEEEPLKEDQDTLPFWNNKREIIDMSTVVNYLVSRYPRALKNISPATDMKIICTCLEYTYEEDMPFIIDCISDDLKKTKEFWITAVRKSMYILKNAPLIYKQDEDVVLSAVRYDGELIEFADECLRKMPTIFLEAIHQIANRRGTCNPDMVCHLIPSQLISDKSFLLNAIKDYPHIFKLVTVPMEIRSDREFMLQVIKKSYGWIIQYVACELLSDRQFIVDAAKLNKGILRWLPENLNGDQELFEMLRKERIEPDKVFSKDDLFF